MPCLCLDLGGTKSVGALFDDAGHELARVRGGPGALSLGAGVTLAAIRSVEDDLRSAGLDPAKTDLAVGLAGIGLRARLAEVRAGLAGYRRVIFVSDGYGALIDATGGKPGILIAVGTGVAAMRLDPDGSCLFASGWGFPAGDLGSGAWIGLQATSALTRHLDGVAQDGPALSDRLATALMAVTGASAAGLMDWLTRGRAADYARLVPIILMAAAEGEAFATDVLARAARELRAVAVRLRRQDGGTVALSGGLAPALLPHLRQVAPDVPWHLSEADPLRGLRLVASGLAPPERPAPRPGLGTPDYDVTDA